MGINHADGWQKTTVSQDLAKQRAEGTKKDMDAAKKTVENLHNAISPNQAPTKTPEVAKTAEPKAPLQTGSIDVPQTVQKTRAETQVQAAKYGAEASNEFLKARDDAKGLKNLEQKLPAAKSGEATATRSAVTQKDMTAGAHLTKQMQPNMPTAPQNTAQAVKARAKLAEAMKTTKDVETHSNASLQKTETQPNIVGANNHSPVQKSEKTDSKKEPREKEKTTKESKSSNNAHSKQNAGKELNALLGGFAGDSSGNQGESENSDVGARRAVPLPENDPDFKVYNEYDEANPGIENLLSKSRIFTKHVEKKLVEISKVDREIGVELKEILVTKGLSERIVGRMKEELKKELGSAKFLFSSVYGGLIG